MSVFHRSILFFLFLIAILAIAIPANAQTKLKDVFVGTTPDAIAVTNPPTRFTW